MDINGVANLAQVVGNVAVVVALIIAIRQLSSSVSTNRSTSADSLVHALNDFYMALAANEDLAHIYRRGRADPTALNDKEHARFFFVCVAWFAYHEHLYIQWKTGNLPTAFYGPWELALKEDLTDPGFIQFWDLERQYFDPAFQEHIHGLTAKPSSS